MNTTFYSVRLKNVFYLYWDFRVLSHCWTFQSHFDFQNFHLTIRLSLESFIFRYFQVFQVSQMFTCGLSDLLSYGRFVGYFCIARILVSSEHKLMCSFVFCCLVLIFYYFVLYISNWYRFFFRDASMAYILFIGFMRLSTHLVLRILSNPGIYIVVLLYKSLSNQSKLSNKKQKNT
jgi:hypothetical protein